MTALTMTGQVDQVGPDHEASYGSFRRLKGRIHTAEKRTSMHSHRPHVASQPAITVLTYALPTSTWGGLNPSGPATVSLQVAYSQTRYL